MYLSGFHLDSAGDPDMCRLQKADFLHHKKIIWTKATLWDDNYGILLSSTIRGFEKKKKKPFLKKFVAANVQAAAVVFVSQVCGLYFLWHSEANLFYLYSVQLLLIASTYALVSN